MGGQVSMATPNDVAQVVAAAPADTSVQVLILWALALSTMINLGTVIWNIFSGPSRRNAAKLEEHGKAIEGQGHRLSAVEQAQRALPSKEDLHAISLGMSEMRGDVKAMRAEMEGNTAIVERLEAVVSRHENHLLKG